MPIEGGSKNGSLASETIPGKGTIRDYDQNGNAKVDYDFGHDHAGVGDPHAHDWIWESPKKGRGNPDRQPKGGRSLHPWE